MRVVGKIVKLEIFKFESYFQVLLFTRIVKLESFLFERTFQLHDLSNITLAMLSVVSAKISKSIDEPIHLSEKE